MIREHKNISIADQIFEKLEHDILIGKYARGEVLTEMALTAELGVSRTPIREALRRLEQEHIIEETSKGAVVIGISREDMIDMYEIRVHTEGLCAARAAKNATAEQLQKMKDILDLQNFYIEKRAEENGEEQENADNIKELDSQFHELLYMCSASKAYVDMLLPIHRKMIKFRKASIKRHSRAQQSLQEHLAIYNALKQGDAELANKLATEHVIKARDNIMTRDIGE